MVDTVFIRDLRIPVVIGIYEWERRIRQEIRLDVEMEFDIGKAAASDELADALDYQAVAEGLAAFLADTSFQLLETLGERSASFILETFPVERVSLTVTKPAAVAGARDVGISLMRLRQG